MATTDTKRTVAWTARALTYFLYAIVVINEIILILGFTLKLFGANPDSGFTQWAYRNLDRVMQPFRGIFTEVPIGAGTTDVQPVLDTSILFRDAHLCNPRAGTPLVDRLARISHRQDRRATREGGCRRQARGGSAASRPGDRGDERGDRAGAGKFHGARTDADYRSGSPRSLTRTAPPRGGDLDPDPEMSVRAHRDSAPLCARADRRRPRQNCLVIG